MRSWVSLLLVIHLFAVVVAVTTFAPASGARPSSIQDRLHELFSPYLRNLHMAIFGVSYPFARFHLTQATTSDVDFSCEVAIAGKGDEGKILLPADGLRPLVRLRRYQSLVNAAASLAEAEGNDELGSILPKTIAGSILNEHAAAEGTIRFRAHYLPEIEALSGTPAAQRAALANYRDIYEAQVFVTPEGVNLLKKSTTLEVAPVDAGAPPARRDNPPATSRPRNPPRP